MILALNLHSQYCLCKVACSVLKWVSEARCAESITFDDKHIKARCFFELDRAWPGHGCAFELIWICETCRTGRSSWKASCMYVVLLQP